MELKTEKIGFKILPYYNKVLVEIFKIVEYSEGKEIHIRLISKEFGSVFRKPIERDYIKARLWADIQMKSIENANK